MKASKCAVLLRRLRPHIEEMGQGHLTSDGLFRCAARSAIVKAYEFATYAQTDVKEPFFVTSTLRGICEDLITLSFLAPLPNREAIIGALMDDNLQEGLERQTAFFAAVRAQQPVVKSRPGQRDKTKAEIQRIAINSG